MSDGTVEIRRNILGIINQYANEQGDVNVLPEVLIALDELENASSQYWLEIAEAARGKILQYEKQIEKYEFRSNEYQGIEVELKEEIKRLKWTIMNLMQALLSNLNTSDLVEEQSWAEVMGNE